MKRDFKHVGKDLFDVIIIGGGIIGTGVARDAALRGFKVLLVEKEDFAYGTTSRSTRLIHGGLRYLQMLDFKLVHQDLHEREILLKIAPHLVHRLEFIIPLLKRTPFYRLTLPVGLKLYNMLAHGTNLPDCYKLSSKDTLKLEPSLSNTGGMTGSYLYYDCQVEYMERLCIENALDAAVNGAILLNHTTMTDYIIKNGAVIGIQLKDNLAGKQYLAYGRIVLNASGPWAGQILNKIKATHDYNIRITKGIHLLTKKISNNALVLFAKSDGRLFFIIPWLNYSLIGTTDTDYTGDKDKVYADKTDIDYLVTETRHYFPSFNRDKIHYTYAGLRPLVSNNKKSASNTSRAHRLIDHESRDNVKGLVSILGGKITAYRSIAEEAVDLLCKKFGKQVACNTAQTALPGALAISKPDIEKAVKTIGLTVETINHLIKIYGSRYTSVLKYAAEDNRLCKPISANSMDILAQVKHAVLEEAALSLNDFMLRRSFLGLLPPQHLDVIEKVAEEMGLLLGWSKTERQNQINKYHETVALDYCIHS
ncbi:MAG: glycerol-3-phosphate dehydrogenase [Dehalococcoidales bacterium]